MAMMTNPDLGGYLQMLGRSFGSVVLLTFSLGGKRCGTEKICMFFFFFPHVFAEIMLCNDYL